MKYFQKCTILKSFYDSTADDNQYFRNYNATAYQYTNLHVVDDVLTTGLIHASEINFLNDTDEYKIGYKALYEKMHKEAISDVTFKNEYCFFSISFTEKKDDIPQYMIYSGEIGVSIGYDFGFEEWGKFCNYIDDYDIEMLVPTIACQKTEEEGLINFCISVPKNVEYCNSDRAKEIIEKIYDVFQKKSQSDLDSISEEKYVIPCFIKNEDFKSEKEVRITVIACEDMLNNPEGKSFGYRHKNVSTTKIEFLKSKNKWLKPYISVFYADGNKNIGWPIKEIWVGPGKDQNRAFESLKMRLEYGELVLFPLPLTEYIARLIVYYKDMIDYFDKSYRVDIGFEEFIKSVFSKEYNKTEKGAVIQSKDYNKIEIGEVIQYVRTKLQKFQGINLYSKVAKDKKARILIGQEIDENYYKDRLISKPKKPKDYNSGAFSDAVKIFEKIKRAYLKILKENIEEIERNKILNVIKKPPKKNGIKIEIKDDVKKKKAQQLLDEYENYHYFSSIGIILHKSKRSLAN